MTCATCHRPPKDPEQHAGGGNDLCDSNYVRSGLDREEVIHPTGERAMLHVDHNLSALGRCEFECPNPERDGAEAEGADKTWQAQPFDPLCDGYGSLGYGHRFVLSLHMRRYMMNALLQN